jgi:hypothetical protein
MQEAWLDREEDRVTGYNKATPTRTLGADVVCESKRACAERQKTKTATTGGVYSGVRLEELLTSRGACQNSRFAFVTRYFAYAGYKKKRLQANPATQASSSSSIMFEVHICCVQNCLGDVITGTDAVTEFMRCRKEATTQAQKQMLIETLS